MTRIRRLLATTAMAVSLLAILGCASTAAYEREKLVDPCMQFDADDSYVFIRHKTEAAREGSLGGFGAASSGGCACQ